MQRISILLLIFSLLCPLALADEDEEEQQPYRFRVRFGFGKTSLYELSDVGALAYANDHGPVATWYSVYERDNLAGYPLGNGTTRIPWEDYPGWKPDVVLAGERTVTAVTSEGKTANLGVEIRVFGKLWLETSFDLKMNTELTIDESRDYLQFGELDYRHWRYIDVTTVRTFQHLRRRVRLNSYASSLVAKYDISPWPILTFAPSGGVRLWATSIEQELIYTESRYDILRPEQHAPTPLTELRTETYRSHHQEDIGTFYRLQGLVGIDFIIGGKMRQRGEPPIGFGGWVRRVIGPGSLDGRTWAYTPFDDFLPYTVYGGKWQAGAGLIIAF